MLPSQSEFHRVCLHVCARPISPPVSWLCYRLQSIGNLCAQVSATDAAMDETLEDQGVRRVISALHAHTWPGLQMKAPPESSNGVRASANGEVLPNGTAEASSAASAAHDAAIEGIAEGPVGSSLPRSRQQDAGSSGTHANGAFELSTDGAGTDDFERLMGNVSAMRSSLQGLPDSERRARAADMAMQMLGALGLEEDSEEDKED